ncbi:DNA polymerase III subunit chi [Microbaculum marinisediminis]|uniref:DNA polymerase III subunit chi n=1 Tax=Microbaculum marinisediminis TaxID=2931392 RepID=A0AAW5R1L2_9HYPH|nr:DNA polymerase III subunit chi [Microbaculum sp. A6E488]MCT8973222.1 DNA polymerase III subunit chi [Microbaculum sp. A6E488]
MTEVLFYHLERRPLEAVLPALLEKCLERGWKAVVQGGSAERLDAIDGVLWTYREDSFLPHGTVADGDPVFQPIYLTTDTDNLNDATVRFLVDGAEPPDLAGYQRAIFIFDGRDEEAVAQARVHWKQASGQGHDVTYWQQNDSGRWERKA